MAVLLSVIQLSSGAFMLTTTKDALTYLANIGSRNKLSQVLNYFLISIKYLTGFCILSVFARSLFFSLPSCWKP
jgi:hypothetical protein